MKQSTPVSTNLTMSEQPGNEREQSTQSSNKVDVGSDTCYLLKYIMREDKLEGRYLELFSIFQPANLHNEDQIIDRIIHSNDEIPKVFLMATLNQEGNVVIQTVHHICRFVLHFTKPSKWDGQIFMFLGDIGLGGRNNVKMYPLPKGAFTLTSPQLVLDVETT